MWVYVGVLLLWHMLKGTGAKLCVNVKVHNARVCCNPRLTQQSTTSSRMWQGCGTRREIIRLAWCPPLLLPVYCGVRRTYIPLPRYELHYSLYLYQREYRILLLYSVHMTHLSHDVHKPCRLDTTHLKCIFRFPETFARMASRERNIPVRRNLVYAEPPSSNVSDLERAGNGMLEADRERSRAG